MDIVEVRPLGGHRLFIRFEDGLAGELDFSEFLDFRGVFTDLRDPARFAEVRVVADWGTIAWPNGADLDPDVLHERVLVADR
jgi:Protein of unknown function (DUF2442)